MPVSDFESQAVLRELRVRAWWTSLFIPFWFLGGPLVAMSGPAHAIGLLINVVGFIGTCAALSMWWRYYKLNQARDQRP